MKSSALSRLCVLGALIFGALFSLSACAVPEEASLLDETPTLTPGPSLTLTATIDWFPATATPTPPATRAPLPTEDQRPGLGTLLWEDDFSDRTSFATLQTETGSISYGKNELSLAVPGAKRSLLSLRSGTVLRDFYLEITIAPSLCRGTDNYGLALRSASEQDYYRFVLTCQGDMRLERLRGGRAEVVQDWLSSASMPGALRVGVWAMGSEMRFFINDVHQFTARDPLYPEGGLGVFARSGGENALTVNFSNLKVYSVEP